MKRAAEKRKINKTHRLPGPERRRQIVEVATKLFSKKGFNGTTTREIAARAGISEATIFKHFSRKEDLYSAIIDRCTADEEGTSLLTKRIQDKSGVELFSAVAGFFLERFRTDPSFARILMFSALEGRGLSDIFITSRGSEPIKIVTEHIEKLIDEGVFKHRDPALSARAFLGMVFHYCTTQEIYGLKKYSDPPDEAVAAVFVDIFMNGMVKEGR